MKWKRIWPLATELTLICILVGCEWCKCESHQWSHNREKLKLLEVGMSEEKVLEIMGQPRERADYSDSEWLVYQTAYGFEGGGRGSTRWMKPANEWLTVLLLRDGKLVSTDRNYWKNRYKYRVLKYPLRY